MKAVKVHCGSAYVKGAAHKWQYYIAQVFETYVTKRGLYKYKATGIICGPFRSYEKTKRHGRCLANDHGAVFVDGYGSLHNVTITNVSATVALT